MERADRWTKETRFGRWFLTTEVWVKYVLAVALDDLVQLLGPVYGPCSTVLDVGCGRGRALPLLERMFKPELLVGLDVDPAMVKLAAREAARCRCRIELKVGPATALDLPDASLDVIFCHQTFHHLADQSGAAREFYRVLKPGGALLLSESCAPFIRSLPVRILFRHPMEVQKPAEQYLELLRSVGFTFTDERVSLPYPWWSRPDFGLREWLGWSAPARRQKTLLNVVAFRDD